MKKWPFHLAFQVKFLNSLRIFLFLKKFSLLNLFIFNIDINIKHAEFHFDIRMLSYRFFFSNNKNTFFHGSGSRKLKNQGVLGYISFRCLWGRGILLCPFLAPSGSLVTGAQPQCLVHVFSFLPPVTFSQSQFSAWSLITAATCTTLALT